MFAETVVAFVGCKKKKIGHWITTLHFTTMATRKIEGGRAEIDPENENENAKGKR
jgi:hypothetical protein